MANTSQFIVYSSSDLFHPILNGTSGSLLNVLNACLVTGYGSKPGAGWTKTGSIGSAIGLAIPDSGSCGIFVQPTGSNATIFIADNAPNSSAGGRNARITGYDYINNFTASVSPANTASIVGVNPFPTNAQLAIGGGTGGAVTVRKSTDTSATERQWIIFADSSSVYGYIASGAGDASSTYQAFMFGDIFSISSGSIDASKCMVVGHVDEQSGYAPINDRLDQLTTLSTATTGHFIQRSYTGTGGSITIGKHGDGVKGSTTTLLGVTQYPNSEDNGLYLSPVWMHENLTSTIRGRMRGFWHILHPISNFSDGQIFTGNVGPFAGKKFMVIKQSANSGIYCMEISNTLETN